MASRDACRLIWDLADLSYGRVSLAGAILSETRKARGRRGSPRLVQAALVPAAPEAPALVPLLLLRSSVESATPARASRKRLGSPPLPEGAKRVHRERAPVALAGAPGAGAAGGAGTAEVAELAGVRAGAAGAAAGAAVAGAPAAAVVDVAAVAAATGTLLAAAVAASAAEGAASHAARLDPLPAFRLAGDEDDVALLFSDADVLGEPLFGELTSDLTDADAQHFARTVMADGDIVWRPAHAADLVPLDLEAGLALDAVALLDHQPSSAVRPAASL